MTGYLLSSQAVEMKRW